MLVGLALSIVIAVVTPYNDYVVDGSFIVGSYFPPIVALCMLAIVLLVNGPLHKFAPRFALAPGELAVVMAMALISCSAPSQGLLRQLIPLPVAPSKLAGEVSDYPRVLRDMNLPPSLFVAEPVEQGANDPAVTAFYSRLPEGEPILWSRWIRPLSMWLLFSGAFFTALISLACLLRYQWTVNERLPFPIVQLQSMLIAAPEKGRAFNAVFSSVGFWIALALVLIVESSSGLHQYFPQYVPEIYYSFDLSKQLADEPWSRLQGFMKTQTIFFTLLGVSYFTQTRTSFSLWGSVVFLALLRWVFDPTSTIVPAEALGDQQLGAAFAFAAGVLWIGRAHWMMILRALVGRSRTDDARGGFVSYRFAAIAFLVGVGGMLTWLIAFAGCTPWVAIVIVTMILIAHFVTARVVAETGLAFVRVHVGVNQLLTTFSPKILSTRDAFLYGVGHYGYMQAARESSLVFALHGLNTIDSVDPQPPGQRRRGIVPLLATTLIIATIACCIASLWCYYRHAIPLSDPASGVLNVYGTTNWPKTFLVDFPIQVDKGLYPSRPQNTWLHLGIGIAIMVVLQALSMRYASWPLMPVGFLMCSVWYMQLVWFSILLGWLAKVIILRFGGATLFNKMKPIFIGLIFGEAVATGVWLIVTLALGAGGYDFKVIRFLPQ